MKKLIALLAVTFSIDTAAFVGTGNEHLGEAREFMRYGDGGANLDYQEGTVWRGRVESFSSVFAEPKYPFAVCYPEGIQSGQLAELAARYMIDPPGSDLDLQKRSQHWHLQFTRKYQQPPSPPLSN